MAHITGLVTLSHSPWWDLEGEIRGPGENFVGGVKKVVDRVRALSPDVIVVFGPDHFRNFFYDLMPPFCIGIERVEGFGDFWSPKGELPSAPRLAGEIYRGVIAAGFDPAFSLNMSVDHGITQPYAALNPDCTTPILPIMVNASGAPRPSLRRCLDFGRAVGDAIRASSGDERVLIVGSGGLSHWIAPASVDHPELTEEARDYLVHGRNRAVEVSAARDESLRKRKETGGVSGKVNREWDEWFLKALATGELEQVLAQDPAEMERLAGNGAHEVRAWIAALGAWGKPVEIAAYEPVPEWVTGMGSVAGFDAVAYAR